MPAVMGQGGDCLSESGVVRLIAGRVGCAERGRVDGHLTTCDRCALLVGEAARDSGSLRERPVDWLRPAVLLPGMVVANRYHVRRLLGVGAMGEVHEVDDALLGTLVALKTLNARLAGDASALARLKREVAAARRVTHANVCRIFDLGTDQNDDTLGPLVFLTMEYLPGVTLSKFLRAHGPLAAQDALPLLVQIADGLAAAHAAGVIHRDLKSDNVMLVEQTDGPLRAVITDFGLASFTMTDDAGVERGSSLSGTLAYAAPERILGARATAASDVYSLGVIAAEMWTNRPPTASAQAGGRTIAMATDDLPAPWQSLMARALSQNPGERFPNGRAVAEALREHARPPIAANRRRAGLAVAGAAALVIAGATMMTGADRGNRPEPRRLDLPAGIAEGPTMSQVSPPDVSDRVARWQLTQPADTSPRKRGPRRKIAPPSPPPSGSQPRGRVSAEPAADDLVRDLRFHSEGDALPADGRSALDLVDPFKKQSGSSER
jgi:serine/threonine protein kinase